MACRFTRINHFPLILIEWMGWGDKFSTIGNWKKRLQTQRSDIHVEERPVTLAVGRDLHSWRKIGTSFTQPSHLHDWFLLETNWQTNLPYSFSLVEGGWHFCINIHSLVFTWSRLYPMADEITGNLVITNFHISSVISFFLSVLVVFILH